jgi:hypothetical protein
VTGTESDWREVDLVTETRKDNRYPTKEMLSWPITVERMKARMINPTQLPTTEFLYRTKFLLDSIT